MKIEEAITKRAISPLMIITTGTMLTIIGLITKKETGVAEGAICLLYGVIGIIINITDEKRKKKENKE